jgi:hypothetical protein
MPIQDPGKLVVFVQDSAPDGDHVFVGCLWSDTSSGSEVLNRCTSISPITFVTTESGSGGVTGADYLVGTAHADLSAEIVVGTAPQGELGNTWASPTVDADHAGTHAVGQGGTGATTLTDGGVLLGSGTSAVTAMAVLADSELIVGDGTTDPVPESGATLRTSIGVDAAGTDNSTNVTLAGTPDYITISGQAITRGLVVLTTDVTGDLPVAEGGTGVSTLTDGGVLLGSGTSAVTAMAVLADSEMIVGDGTTDPVAESGSTLRTSIGVGTGDSPTFTGLTLSADIAMGGANIDNGGVVFLTEQAEADADVAGKGQLWVDTATPNVFMFTDDAGTDFQISGAAVTASSTTTFTNKTIDANATGNSITNIDLTADVINDLPVAEGGTGASTLTDGGVLLGSGTSAVTAMAVLADSEMIVGDGTTDPVAESGTTLRTSIGVGTGDSPTFTGLTLSADLDMGGANADDVGVIFLKEQAEADADVAGSGQIWVDTATPNKLYFTNDAGTDFQLGIGSAVSALNNATANELTTVGATTTELDAESNLTFDGTVLTLTGTMKIAEQADAESDTAGQGQLWVDTATPNVLKFTDDAGTDFTIAHNATTTLSSLTTVGTIGSGTWEGTTVAVDQGGTGATSLTDGGILLGSGTGAITAMSVLADGALVVGDGSTDPVALTAFTSSTGQLKHESGGIEADISAIVKGGLLLGTATGTMGILAIGSDDQVLTLASGTATWADASGGGGGATFPATHVSTVFGDGDDNRIATSATNGSATFESDGMKIGTTSTISSHAISRLPVMKGAGDASIFTRLPSFRSNFYIETSGSDYTVFTGFGPSALFSTGTWVGTKDHLGFKAVRASSGDVNLYATQGDNSTENASSALTTLSTGDIDLAFKVATETTGGAGQVTSCNYYYSKRRAAWSSATNLTANGARTTENEESMAFGVANNDVASNTEIRFITAEFGG